MLQSPQDCCLSIQLVCQPTYFELNAPLQKYDLLASPLRTLAHRDQGIRLRIKRREVHFNLRPLLGAIFFFNLDGHPQPW